MEIITDKYIQINHIIKEIEESLMKMHILNWNSVDFDEYSDYLYDDVDRSDFNEVIISQLDVLRLYYRLLKYLPGTHDHLYDESKTQMLELFDEYEEALNRTKNELIKCYFEHQLFPTYTNEEATDYIKVIKSCINPMKFTIKDVFMNHPEFNYKFEAKYYLDKINQFVIKNKYPEYIYGIIEKQLNNIDECLSGEEVITRLQKCYNEINSSTIERIFIETKYGRNIKEVQEYINNAYNTIEQEREYMTNPWRKIDMIFKKIVHELKFFDDEKDINRGGWYLINGCFQIIHNSMTKDINEPYNVLRDIESIQHMFYTIIRSCLEISASKDVIDDDDNPSDIFSKYNEKYISPISEIIKQQLK